MFVLYEMTRDVRIDPVHLTLERGEGIREELNRKLANRVMLGKGLCMVLWDIGSVGAGMIYPGDGGVHSQVSFRYIIFRPFQDEIIVGKIKNCTPDGVHGKSANCQSLLKFHTFM
jgi:DNA-directed RNA polymerase III subunit RPC8